MSKRARLSLTSSRFVMPVSAGLVSTEVEVAGERLAAVGLGGVIVTPNVVDAGSLDGSSRRR
jgi:hypothetical protein